MRPITGFFSGLISKARQRGQAYTSLDAMKMFAIVNMTSDHIGLYFFPDDLWWRAIGRITFPVWFFLVGYSRSRALGSMLWIYALLLIVDRPFFNYYLFPLNALFTIILCRVILNFFEDHKLLPARLPEIIAACVMLTPFTTLVFEYGSIAFLYAIFGRMIVQKQKQHFLALTITSYLTFIFWQFVWFEFNLLQGAYVVLGTLWVVWWLSRFTNDVVWSKWEDSTFKTCIAVLSRNTLPYYFYHRLILEVAAAFILRQGFHLALRL